MIANSRSLALCRVVVVAAISVFAMMSAAQAQQPSPAAIELARQVVLIKGGNNMFDPIVPGVIESVKNTFLPTNPGLAKDLNEVAAQLRKEYEPKHVELLNTVSREYAAHFSEQELKDLLAFYKTPLGQKVITEEPRALDAALRQAQEWANNFSEEVIAKMRAEMKKRGANL